MNFHRVGGIGLPLFAAAGVIGAIIVVACSGTSKKGGGPVSSTTCTIPEAGAFPVAECVVPENETCPAAGDPSCPINTSKCGDPATCLPMAANKGKAQLDFRMRRLNVQAPAALAKPFVQTAIVTKNMDLPAKECADDGNGAFNWLLRVDTTGNTITTGGAPPSADPFGVGYCFYNHFAPPDNTTNVVPVTVKTTKNSDGSYSAAPAPLLNVPIFLGGQIDNVVILPIADATFHSFTIGSDDNCIGRFNPTALGVQCADDSTTCEKWKTAGSLGGYITLEAADTVNVADLNESLCVLLTQTNKDPKTGKCQRTNGKVTTPGDYCSTSKKAGDCADSFWLAATFAAAAIKIDESGSVPQCKPGLSDAGTDSGSDGAPSDDGGSDANAADAASE